MDDDKALCAEIRPLISRFRELPLGHDGGVASQPAVAPINVRTDASTRPCVLTSADLTWLLPPFTCPRSVSFKTVLSCTVPFIRASARPSAVSSRLLL